VETDVKEFIPLNRNTIAKLIENRWADDSGGNGKKRRRMERWPFPGQLQIWITDAAGEEVMLFGTCHNLNENGVGVTCERHVEPGQRVPIAIHQPEATFHGDGVVRHCTPTGSEYFVGIEFIQIDDD